MSDEGPHSNMEEDEVDELRLEEVDEPVTSEADFSFNGNAGIEDMGRDLLQPVEGEGPSPARQEVSPEERRAEAVNIATTLPNASVSELLSAAYEIEEYLIRGRERAREGTTPTE